MEPICKKSIFQKLLIKLTGEGNFFVKLIKQTDGCVMGSAVSVVLADIYIC